MAEKRRFMRLKAPLVVHKVLVDGCATDYRMAVVDVSREGLRLSGADLLPVNSYVELQIKFPGIIRLFIVFGQVAWSKKIKSNCESGIRITKIDENDRAQLLEYAYSTTLYSDTDKKEH